MRRHGCLVIGGGLIGLASAYALAGRVDSLTVIVSQADGGRGASHANGGMLTTAMCDPWNAPGAHRLLTGALLGLNPAMRVRWAQVPSLLSWGRRFLRHSSIAERSRATRANFDLAQLSALELGRARHAAALGQTCWARGSLAVYRTRAALRDQEALSKSLATHGLHFHSLSPKEVVAREPMLAALAGQLVGGLWYPDDQSADSGALCRALASHLTARGVVIRADCGALGLRHDRGGIAARLGDGAELRPEHTIVAAGVHSPALVADLGIALPVAPVKGHSLTVNLNASAQRPGCAVYDHASHVVYTPLLDTLRVAGTADFSGFDATPDRAALHRILVATRALYPMLALPDTIDAAVPWAGLRPVSADGLPFIGPSAIPGLWLNTGHGALGLTHAMGSGALLADLILQRTPRIDPKPYRTFGRA